MSYIGNQVTSVPHVVDAYSGDGITATFGPLVRAPAGTAAIAVFISGSYKTPGTDYSLNGDYITFVSTPGVGANIIIHHLGNGTTTQVPSDGSVTGTKLAVNSIRSNNIVAGQITGNLLATSSVSGNNIGINSINASNNIVSGTITGNLLAASSVSGNNIGINSINASNSIVAGSITGNLIGTGSISANNFAGGGITSNVLASNLSISTVRVAETINVVTSAVQGNYNVHVGNSTVYNFTANTTGNLTFNFVSNDATSTGTTGRVNDLITIGQSVSVALMIRHGSVRYRANLYVDGVLQTAFWAGNTQPLYQSTGGTGVFDVYNFSVMKIGNNAYDVLASNTQFGRANGQGAGITVNPFGPVQ